MDSNLLNKIKRLTVSALVADDMLMGILVFKGGNALNLAYDISNRGSIDIDFSMEKDFTEAEKNRIKNQASSLLNTEFSKEELIVFDVRFFEKPNHVHEEVESFWGGYCLEFKIISAAKFKQHSGDPETIRRNAIAIAGNNSTVFQVEISKYEYVAQKRAKDIEGATVYVYTPEMLALEKLRALCQQVLEYKSVVKSMTQKSRARDFYDIFNLTQHFKIDFKSKENIELTRHIFEAKRVPLNYISQLNQSKELHRQSWPSVEDTVSEKESLKDFNFYFAFVLDTFKHLAKV